MSKRQLRRISPTTRDLATRLRREATVPEKLLWYALRDRRADGLKFRRQHPVEPYVVDFYCPNAKLVVEVDGMSHDYREDYDERRSALLGRLGLRVVRVSNDDELHNLDGVVAMIIHVARQPF